MKITIHLFMICVILVIPLLVHANGGGGGEGGEGGGEIQEVEETHHHPGGGVNWAGGGGVSWIPNPNGEGVIGSSVWAGPRPEGPFQDDKSIQDALEELAQGAGSKYTQEQVKDNMRWAQNAGLLTGIKVPNSLVQAIKGPQPAASPPPGQTSSINKKIEDYAGVGLNVLNDLLDKNKKGVKVTPQQLELMIGVEVVKDKISKIKKDPYNELKSLFGYKK